MATAKKPAWRGSRWEVLSFLETSYGPWGAQADFDGDVVASWKAQIDWHADRGLNVIIGSIPYSHTDTVYLGWGFHYLLDFKGYPHGAELFTADFRRRTAETLNAIFAHARKRGVTCLAHHFNYMAPRRMAMAMGWAPRYNRTAADWTDEGMNVDVMRLLVHNCCWDAPGYADFMQHCWKETLRLLPDLGGFLVTPGEANLGLYAPEQLHLKEDIWLYYTDTRFVETQRRFIETFHAAVSSAGRMPVVRCWGVEGAYDFMPKGVTYLIKHQVFDCIGTGADRLVGAWLRTGHDLWVEPCYLGENAGPIAWLNRAHCRRIAEEVLGSGVTGYVTNDKLVVDGMSGRATRTAFEMLHSALLDPASMDDAAPWAAKLTPDFGPRAPEALDALEAISEQVLLQSQVVHRLGEGSGFADMPTLTPPLQDFYNLGQTNGTPPPWFRGDVATVKEYLDYLSTNPWTPNCLESVRGGRRCPIEALAGAAREAARAEEILEGILPDVRPSARKHWQLVRCSAGLARAAAECIGALCLAKVLFNCVRACLEISDQKKLAADALAAFDAAEGAAAAERGWAAQLPDAFRCEHFGKKYRNMVNQFHPYRFELRRLLDGRAWSLSRYHLTWKSIHLDEVATQPYVTGDGIALPPRATPWPPATERPRGQPG
jgi:hypothetical protein